MFKRSSASKRSPLFLLGDHSSVASVHEQRAYEAFDETVAASQRVGGESTSREFLGVTLDRRRLRMGVVALAILFSLFVGRAAQLQILSGEEYHALAEGNRVRTVMVPSSRGIIYDRQHRVLADNQASFRLTAIPGILPETLEERSVILADVATRVGGEVPEMLAALAEGDAQPTEPVVLVEDIPYEPAMAYVLEDPYLGIAIEMNAVRAYRTTDIPTLSHVLGYTGRINPEEYEARKASGYRRIDDLGKTGVEQSYEEALRGTFGRKAIEVDAFGDEISIVAKDDPVDGANLVLSIDANLTATIERILEERLGTSARASVIVMDPSTGELLALVSTPSYDANAFAQGIDSETYDALLNDPNQPLFHRAIAGEYPSGSTFKPVVAAAALAEGLIDRHTSFLSVGGLRVGPWFFYDWRAGGHGVTNVTKALAESVNTFFYYIGGGYDTFTGLGVERLMSYAERFGFGSALGIDLPGEGSGFLPSKLWKEETKGERWYVGDTYNVSIGQGDLLVTPLQIASMTSVFANGGTLYQPHVGLALESDGNTTPIAPVVLDEQVVDENAVQIVREGMREAVTSGSARRLLMLPITSAGKTGTAQWSTVHNTHAWFTAFAPYEEPEVVITVLVEEGGGGDVVSVPIAYDILEWWFTQYEVIPAVEEPLDQSEPSA